MTAAVQSVEVLTDTNKQLLSKHAEEMQTLRHELYQTTRQCSDLQQQFQLLQEKNNELRQNLEEMEAQKGEIRSAQSSKQSLEQANQALIGDLAQRDEKIIALEQKLTKSPIPAGLLASMQLRQQKATDAISHLQDELSADALEHPTPNEKAIQAIVVCLKDGLNADDPQAYFDAQKDDLKTHLNALRGIKSVMNTAWNAILTVLAVCSVVGIPALYYTGIWQKNAEKNGSFFAFSMFGAEQKAKCDIYEATQALGVTFGA